MAMRREFPTSTNTAMGHGSVGVFNFLEQECHCNKVA